MNSWMESNHNNAQYCTNPVLMWLPYSNQNDVED